jgi:hypothetical protein
LDSENGLWQKLVKSKYGINKGIINRISLRHDDAPVWKDLLKETFIH